jgi:hypothetical protein
MKTQILQTSIQAWLVQELLKTSLPEFKSPLRHMQRDLPPAPAQPVPAEVAREMKALLASLP